MRVNIRPDALLPRVTDIDARALYAAGIRAIIFDLDNTLTHWNERIISSDVREWVDESARTGLKMCICSNNGAPRVAPVAQELGMDYISEAGKPSPRAFQRAAQQLKLPPAQIVAVGDQLMTDIIGAKCAGLGAILVNPIGGREYWGTYINRALEKPLMLLLGLKRPPRTNTGGERA